MNQNYSGGEIISPTDEPIPLPSIPTASFFGALVDGTSYQSILYLLLLFPVSIGIFVWSVTGLSLSIGLAVTIFGLPVAYVFMLSLARLNYFQAGMGEAILGTPTPKDTFRMPQGGFFERLLALVSNRHVISGLIVSILLFPFGIFAFVMVVVLLSVSLAFMATVTYPLFDNIYDFPEMSPAFLNDLPLGLIIAGFVIIGFLLFVLSLHLFRFMAYGHQRVIHQLLR